MAKESTLSKLKWIGVSAIISSIISFIFIPFLNYFYNAIMKFDSSIISLYYNISIVIGIAGSVFLISYLFLVEEIRIGIMMMKNGDFFQPIHHKHILFFAITTR